MWFFTALGVLVAAWAVYRFISGSIRFFKAHFTGSKLDFSKMGTAVITGASDGIGKAYAFELAKRGLKRVVLLGRNREKLQGVADEIRAIYPSVDTRLIIADFENTDMYDRIEAEMEDLHDVDILINNVGANINARKRLDEIKPANFFKSININIVSAWMMSYIVVRKMIADGRHGAVVNISSSAVRFPPRMMLYASSKSFVSCFSRSLRLQYQNEKYGITVQDVEPFLVSTKLAHFISGSMFIVTPEMCASQALNALGHYKTTAGARRQDLLMAVMLAEPSWRTDQIMRRGTKAVIRTTHAIQHQQQRQQQQSEPTGEQEQQNQPEPHEKKQE